MTISINHSLLVINIFSTYMQHLQSRRTDFPCVIMTISIHNFSVLILNCRLFKFFTDNIFFKNLKLATYSELVLKKAGLLSELSSIGVPVKICNDG